MKKRKIQIVVVLCMMMAMLLTGCGAKEGQVTVQNTPNHLTSERPDSTEETMKSDNDSLEQTEATNTPSKTPEQTPEEKEEQLQEATVHFIDVGQADCILIESDGQTVLIDAGNNADGDDVISYIKNEGIKTIDYLIGTHPDEDHIGGLDVVIENFQIGTIYMPKFQATTKTFEDVLLAAKKKGLKISAPNVLETFTAGECKFQILAPDRIYDDSNESSIVLKMEHGNNSFLFTGDAGIESEYHIEKLGVNLHATVLKVGHHGSSSSTANSFLEAVNPSIAVISCGADNKYGHPHKETMTRLQMKDITIYRTDLNGTITMTSDGTTLEIQTGKNETEQTKPVIKDEVEQEGQTERTYIGNLNTKKFHLPSCNSLPDEKNQIQFKSREEAIKQGYEPCKRCHP